MSAGTVGPCGGIGVAWRRLGIGVLALALLTIVLPAFAHTPETGIDASVTLTASPSTDLADGQLVTVTGTGFAPSTTGTIRQCGGTVTAPECDPTTTAFVTTAAGVIPPTAVAVKRIVNTGATTSNCAVQACALVATAGAKSSLHQIRMAGAGTVLTTSSTTTSSTTSSSTTSSSITSTTSTTSSTSTTPTVPAPSTSTSSPVPTSVVSSTSCAGLRWTQAEAIAGIDSLIAAFPQFRDVGVQAREATSAKFAQTLAIAGC